MAEVSNNDENYEMKLRYLILDTYDWKTPEECNVETEGKCFTEVSHFNDELLGKGKAFPVKIEYDIKVTWKKGSSPNIELQSSTPYKNYGSSGKF